MITLKELFKVMWTIGEINITAREPGSTLFIHEWEYGDDLYLSIHKKYRQLEGKLTVVNKKINVHGDEKKNGNPVTGYGVKEELFPPELIEAPITHLSAGNMSNGYTYVCADVEIQKLTVLNILDREEGGEGQ